MKSTINGSAAAMALLAALATAPAAAQDPAAERERAAREAELQAEREVSFAAPRTEAMEVQLREAEERLAEAAAHVAELSRRRLPEMALIGQRLMALDRPVLGVTIGGSEEQAGPVEGVEVVGVTPGSAAEDAGLRAGDLLVAINDESLSAATADEANRKLLDFMQGVEEGDELEVEYLRDGNRGTITLEPRKSSVLAFHSPGWQMPLAPRAPGSPGAPWFVFQGTGNWGDMEMVSLTAELGRYFGTDSGLLVVRAPNDDDLKLKDGDVIQRIDGREPQSVAHAMRILASYQAGETLEIEIMRDKKREVLSIEIPDERQGLLWRFDDGRPRAPVAAPPHIEIHRAPGRRI